MYTRIVARKYFKWTVRGILHKNLCGYSEQTLQLFILLCPCITCGRFARIVYNIEIYSTCTYNYISLRKWFYDYFRVPGRTTRGSYKITYYYVHSTRTRLPILILIILRVHGSHIALRAVAMCTFVLQFIPRFTT